MRLNQFASWLSRLVWGSSILLFTAVGCMDDVEYTTSPADRLAFSADTVRLDTVISGQATGTYTFQAYNPASKAIRLQRVYLEDGADSPFRVNVDGTFLEGGVAADLEIGAEDSLRVFLFANVPDADSDEAVGAKDNLVFVTEGGAVQKVALEVYGQSVIPLRGLIVERDTTLSARRPYQVTDSLVVRPSATLRLAPGVRLYFHPEVNLVVRGTLLAEGTADAPVQMRGDRLGNMFTQQPYDRIPGQWGGVVLASTSYGNRLNHIDIHSGTFGLRCDSSNVQVEKLRLENSIVHNVSGDALSVRSASVFVGNSQLTNAGGNCITLRGGSSLFVHCTVGNFYPFVGGRGVALDFSNADGDVRLPLERAEFVNCIITGYSADEIMGTPSSRYTDAAFNYAFSHCLLCTPQADPADEHFDGCLWDNDEAPVWRDGNFSPAFDLDQLLFTFQLDSASAAVDSADPTDALLYPTDRLGRSRFADDGPDMGCYERLRE